jgi:hypothetical protein
MPTSRFERFLPLSGVLTGVLFGAAILLTGPGLPSVTSDPAKRLTWLADHQGIASLSGFASAYAVVTLLLFASGIRQALRSGEPGESTYSSAAFAGGVLVATAIGLSSVSLLASAEAASKGNGAVVTTLGFMDDYSWVPFIAGAAVLFLATGLGGMRTATLPKWLGIVTVVMGVLCLAGPTGIAVYLLSPLWFVVTGVVLARRGAAATASTTAVAAPARV